MKLPYQPYYCEENAYRICELLTYKPHPAGTDRTGPATGPDVAMIFIFSDGPWVAVYNQCAVAAGTPVYWDYHVVAVVRRNGTWRVFDPDSRIDAGTDLSRYLKEAFSAATPGRGGVSRPLFRWVPWDVARSHFGSDRRHMRDTDGELTQPPPPWPPINPERHTLPAFLSRDENGYGRLYSLPELLRAGVLGEFTPLTLDSTAPRD